MRQIVLSSLVVCCISASGANVLTGVVRDRTTKEPLPAATITLVSPTNKKFHVVTDNAGRFKLDAVNPGKYTLQSTYVGYETWSQEISVDSKNQNVVINMKESSVIFDEVVVNGRATRAEQKGDSLIYNAEAFKVLQGSTAEDLLSKMPGIVVEGGEVQAQGESVKKILVDGQEFFEGDINLALRNLPSDIIANIEVFDKKSEQAEFTGFDDGEDVKTINIVTKSGFKEGTFGELYGGYGTDNRYKAGGNINYFDKINRLSILGMSNNVNQLNFSQEDLAGVMAASSGGRGRKGGRQMGRGNQSADFMVGNQGGVTQSHGLGLNYVGMWNEKIKFTGSYFFNQSDNNTETMIDRHFFDSVEPGLNYRESSNSDMENWNHRLNFKLDYAIDKNNQLQIRPTFSFQNNDYSKYMFGENLLENAVQSDVESNQTNQMKTYKVGTDLVYRHRFDKAGRTLSFAFNGSVTNKAGDKFNDYLQNVFGEQPQSEKTGQYNKTDEKDYSVRGNLMFTEQLIDGLQMQLNYKMSYQNENSDEKVFLRSSVTDLYDQLDEDLSNEYASGYLTQSGGLGLRYRKERFNLMAGVDLQYATLDGQQYFPFQTDVSKRFFSALPSVTMRYSLDKGNSFILRYRSNSSAPEISDLQEVVDNSNPLFLSTGNPDLEQQINHSVNLRYIRTSMSGQTLIAMAGLTVRSNYVADSTFVATENTVLPSGLQVDKGVQFTKPVNMNGYYSLQSMLTYGFPLDLIRSNVNFSISANYSAIPNIYNGTASKTKELNLIPKVIIGSNISENLDFTVSYSATMNKIINTVSADNNSSYINHSAGLKFGWIFWKGFSLSSTVTYTGYTGLDLQDYWICNASLGKKFLKNNQAEIKIEAYDLFRQNKSFVHQIAGSYYDYIRSNVMEPYFMLSFVYTIR